MRFGLSTVQCLFAVLAASWCISSLLFHVLLWLVRRVLASLCFFVPCSQNKKCGPVWLSHNIMWLYPFRRQLRSQPMWSKKQFVHRHLHMLTSPCRPRRVATACGLALGEVLEIQIKGAQHTLQLYLLVSFRLRKKLFPNGHLPITFTQQRLCVHSPCPDQRGQLDETEMRMALNELSLCWQGKRISVCSLVRYGLTSTKVQVCVAWLFSIKSSGKYSSIQVVLLEFF